MHPNIIDWTMFFAVVVLGVVLFTKDSAAEPECEVLVESDTSVIQLCE